MPSVTHILQYTQSFFVHAACFSVAIAILVFVHEFGHYLAARLNGVKVTAFSIGFGPQLLSFTDKHGTAWKICAIPAGGYVQMYGDADESSKPDFEKIAHMSQEEQAQTFYNKKLWQKSIITAGGPIANYIQAILIMTVILFVRGQSVAPPTIQGVEPNSPAAHAHLAAGDIIISIDKNNISSFYDIVRFSTLHPNQTVNVTYSRNGNIHSTPLKIANKEVKDKLGKSMSMGYMGIASPNPEIKNLSISQAIVVATTEAYNISGSILKSLKQILVGSRNIRELGGPIQIAGTVTEATMQGIVSVAWLIAMISINLGLVNLLPIPTLDGGYLMYYLFETVSRSPIPKSYQLMGLKIGFTLLMATFAFITYNDLKHLIKVML